MHDLPRPTWRARNRQHAVRGKMSALPCERATGRGDGEHRQGRGADRHRRESVPRQSCHELHRLPHAQGRGSIAPRAVHRPSHSRPRRRHSTGQLRTTEMIVKGCTAPVFLIPCMIESALLLYFLRGFRAPVSSNAWAGAESALLAVAPLSVRGTLARSGHLVTESADG
jgi:hypothetical protein